MKDKLILLAMLLFTSNVFAQVSGLKFGGSGNDWIESITTDSIGNYYVMGQFQNTITFDSAGSNKTYTASTTYNTFVVKYNCLKVFQWCLRISGTGHVSYAATHIRYKQNALFLIANYQSSTTITSSNNSTTTRSGSGTYSGLLLKVNTSGVLLWANTVISSTGKAELNDLEISPSGSIYITGLFYGTTATANGQNSTSITTSTNLGNADAFIFKFNRLGETVWKLNGGGTGDDVGGYLKFDNIGNLYASGQYSCCGAASATFGSFVVTNTTGWATWISKIDTTGAFSWLIGQTGEYGCAGGLQIDENNFLYFTGNFKGTKTVRSFSASGFTKSITSNGGTDIVVAKYTPNGALLWANSFGSSGDDYSWRTCYKNKKLFVPATVVGTVTIVQGSNTFTFTTSGGADDVIAIYDSTGICLGGTKITGSGGQRGLTIEYSLQGKLYVGGYFDGSIVSNSVSLSSTGAQDGYIYVFDSTSSISSTLIQNRTNTICHGDSIKLNTGLSLGTFLWTPGLTLNDSTSSNPFAKPTTNATYILKYTNPQGCVYYDTAKVFLVNVTANAGSDTTICSGDSIQLSATGGVVYLWSPSTGLSNVNIANPIAKPTVTTNYVVSVSNGVCSKKDTVTVYVNPLPTIQTDNDFTVCFGSTKTLVTNGTATRYLWSNGDTTSTLSVNITKDTSFWVRGQIGSSSCFAFDTVNAYVISFPMLQTRNDTSICIGNNILLTTSGNANRFLWSNGDTTSTINVVITKDSTFWVRGQIGNNSCYSFDTVKISAIPLPFVFTNNDTSICSGTSKTLYAFGNANRYLWSTGDTTSSIIVSPTTSSLYWLRGQINNSTCYSYDTINISVFKCDSCFNCSVFDTINIGNLACFPFNNNSNDLSNNNNHGTPLNISYVNNRISKPNSAASFNGSSSLIQFSPTNLQLNNYTYCAWVKLNSLPSNGNAMCILGIGGTTTDQGILISNNYGGNNGWTIIACGSNGISYTASSGTLPATNNWYFVCQIRDNTGAKLFVNGSLVASTTIPNINAGYSGGTIEAVIGARPNSASRMHFNGLIDDVRIYNRLLSSIEIYRLYQNQEKPIANAGIDKNICIGDSVQLSCTGGITYKWTPAIGLNNANISNPIAKPIVSTDYIVTIDSGNCASIDTIRINVGSCSSTCYNCVATVPLNAGLIACYPFSGNTNDETLNGHNGTNNGATLTVDRFGNPNSAYNFNGTSNYISIPFHSAFNFSPTGTFSLSAWVCPANGISSYGGVIVKSLNTGAGPWDYGLYVTDVYKGMTGYANNNLLTTNTSIPPTQWYLLTATYDNGDWKIYVNCQLDNSRINSGLKITQSNGSLAIGKKGAYNTDYFSGKIDDVRIYNRLLTIAEIQQMYTCNNFVTVVTNNDTTICGGSAKTLKATGTTTKFLWSTGDTASSIVVFPNVTTSYWVRGQIGTTACYAYDTVTITTLPVPTIQTQNDTTICKGSFITLNATGNANHYLWSTGDTTAAINVAVTKDTVLWVRGQNGSIACFASDTIHITAADFPLIQTVNDTFVCSGNSISLTTSGNANRFLWSNGDTTASLTITPTKDTIVWVRGQIGNLPCYAFDSVKVVVYSFNTVNLGNDTALCEGSFYTLNAPSGIPRLWSTGDTAQSITVTILADTINFLPQKFWVSSGFYNCVRTDTILLHAITKPKVGTIVNGQTTICEGESVSITVNRMAPAAKIIWNTGDTAKTISVTPLATTTYMVTYLNNACGFKDSITINVIPKPIITVSPNDTICAGESTILNVRGTSSYLWSTTAIDSNLTVSPLNTTIYWVVGSNGICASDTQKVTIVVVPKPNSLFAATPLKGSVPLKVQFDNQSAYATSYLWNFGDGDTSTSFSPSHIYTVKGKYIIELIVSNNIGCSDTSIITIIADEKYVIYIPNVFTPNGDEINDAFNFYVDGAKNWEGMIFNRWGEQLYAWKSPDGKGWDGTYNGITVPDGIYLYLISVKDNANYRHVYKGIITVIR